MMSCSCGFTGILGYGVGSVGSFSRYRHGASASTAQNESLAPGGKALRGNVALQPDQSCSMVRKRFQISGRIANESEMAQSVHSWSGAVWYAIATPSAGRAF